MYMHASMRHARTHKYTQIMQVYTPIDIRRNIQTAQDPLNIFAYHYTHVCTIINTTSLALKNLWVPDATFDRLLTMDATST